MPRPCSIFWRGSRGWSSMTSPARKLPIDSVTDNIGDDQELVIPAGLFSMFFSEELQEYARRQQQTRQHEESES